MTVSDRLTTHEIKRLKNPNHDPNPEPTERPPLEVLPTDSTSTRHLFIEVGNGFDGRIESRTVPLARMR